MLSPLLPIEQGAVAPPYTFAVFLAATLQVSQHHFRRYQSKWEKTW